MKAMVIALGLALSGTASALTFEAGQVYENGQVVDAASTEIGQRQLEENGYILVGNNVVIDIDGVGPVTVTVQEAITGGTVLREAIVDSAREVIEDLSELEGLTYEEIDQRLRDSDIGASITVEEVQELIDETQFREIREDYGSAVEEALRDFGGQDVAVDVIDEHGNLHCIGNNC